MIFNDKQFNFWVEMSMDLLTFVANTEGDIESKINSLSLRLVLIASLALITLILVSSRVVAKKKYKAWKKPLFIAIILAIVAPSLLMTGSTIYINTIADSKGPVHWHTDIEFWVCGQEVELRDPYEFLSNKVGTSTYHEHDDKRIHLEGVVIDKEYDASLEKFMKVTGGFIDQNSLTIPTEASIFEDDTDGDKATGDKSSVEKYLKTDGEGRSILEMKNGAGCSDDGYAEVQAFVIRYDEKEKTYTQTKLEEPQHYTMRDESTVPPGDCLIVEFDAVKSRTDKLCLQYGVRDKNRCIEFGVAEAKAKHCDIQESTGTPFRDGVEEIIQQEAL